MLRFSSFRSDRAAAVVWGLAQVIVCAMVASTALAGGSATFQPLGFLDPDNFGPVIAYAVSGNGHVAAGEALSPIGFEAFRWTNANGIVGMGALANPRGFPSSEAHGCSFDGSVIVGSSALPNSLNEDGSPFRWTAQSGLVFLGSLGGTDGGVARGCSSDGSVVVGYSSNADFNLEAFRRTQAGGMVGLGSLSGPFDSQATGVSGDGSVIVGSSSNRSFKWRQATGMVELQPLTFRAFTISRDGRFAVGDNVGRAARLDLQSGALFTVPHVIFPGLGGDTDQAWGVNADGSVIVGIHNLNQGQGSFGRAFVWDAKHGTRIVRDMLINEFGLGAQLAGWELNNATAVSDDGRTIVGYGFHPSGEQAAWIVTLPGGCDADVSPGPNGNGVVDVDDLLAVITQWGPCPAAPQTCPANILNSGSSVNRVDVDDLLAVITGWGPCP